MQTSDGSEQGETRGRIPNPVISARASGRTRMEADAVLLRTRRSLLRTALWSGLSAGGAGLLLGAINYLWPRGATGVSGGVRSDASQVPRPGGAPIRVPEARCYLVNLPPGAGASSLDREAAKPSRAGGVLALSERCPHLGCTIPWRRDFEYQGVRGWFRCPCHGSTFSIAGVAALGPAPHSMDTLPVRRMSDGTLLIRSRPVTRGGPDNPQRTVR